MNENAILVKTKLSQCLKCKIDFKLNEEIIFLKDSKVMHKSCYDQVRQMIKKDV